MSKLLLFAVIIGLLAVVSVSATTLTTCGTLSTPGGFYVLANDVTVGGVACFSIAADNISFDGNGHNITGTAFGSTGITEGASHPGLTVKNFGFHNLSYALNFVSYNVSGSSILDNVFVNDSEAIIMNGRRGNVLIRGNNFQNGSIGVLLSAAPEASFVMSTNTFTGTPRVIDYNGAAGAGLGTNFFRNNIVTNGSFYITAAAAINCDKFTFSGNQINVTNDFNYNVCPLSLNESVGNYWTDPFGFGFSQLCVDVNNDGICDGTYTAYTGATDYLPIHSLGVNVTPAVHTPPNYLVKFMGTDPTVTNFIFRAFMTSPYNISAFEAQVVDYQGEFYNTTTIFEKVNFNRVADLALVTNDYCLSKVNLTAGTPGTIFGSDGSLFINESSGCLWATKITLPAVVLAEANGNISASANVQFFPALGGISQRSFALYSSSNQFIGGLFFAVSGISNTVNITTDNGTVLVTNGTTGGNYWFTISAQVSPSGVTWTVHNALFTLLGTVTMSASGFSDVSIAAVDESATADGTTNVDSFSLIAAKQIVYPPYVFFDTLIGSNPVDDWKEIDVPIGNRSFGAYETILWGTDSVLGLSYYVDPDYETFTFDENTPKLTPQEVADALNQLNSAAGSAGVVTGDLATDWLPRLWNLIGLKTVGSKMLGGLILMIITALALSGLGEAVIILVIAVEGVVFAIPQVGLFPVWFIIIEVVIAAGMIALAIRKGATGN